MSVGLATARLFALIVGAGALGGLALPALVAGAPGTLPTNGPNAATLTLPGAAESSATAPAAAVSDVDEQRAIALLRRAAKAGAERTYSGTQFVTSWSASGTSSVVVDLQHRPGRGVLVRLSAASGSGTVDDAGAATLDSRALEVLEQHYVLTVAPQPGRCAGRPASIVEARPRGSSVVAGRFWLDVATGLVLRRALYDAAGRAVRAAAFVDLQMTAGQPWTGSTRSTPANDGVPVTSAQASRLHRSGWRLPATLGDSLELFDSRLHGGVLHLSYTDGLFAVSVFTQQGRLNSASVKGWERVTMAGGPAWTRPGLSQRVVWAGRGWVYTAVADAPDSAVVAAVAAFPVTAGESFPHRVVRGLHRMGSWVDPRR